MTTNAYIRGVRAHGWPEFDRRLWQRGYYDRVIRDPDALHRIREYIVTNPAHWRNDFNAVGHVHPHRVWADT